MKSIKFYAVAAALVSSLLSFTALAQGQAAFKKAGGNPQATCTYTGLTIINGALEVTCSDDVAYLAGTPTGSGPFALTVSVSPSGSGTVLSAACTTGSTGGCNGSVPANTSVTLTASAASGFTFSGWSGGACAGTNPTCSFTMTAGQVIQANFTSGTATPPPGGGPTVPAGCTGLTPTTNHVAAASIGPSNQSTRHVGVMGTTYSFPLPTNKGIFATSTTVFTPGQLGVEVAISQCPGDMGYYKLPSSKVLLYGTLRSSCGGVFGAESGGVRWTTVNASYTAYCVTPTGQNWYMNIRYVDGTCPTGSCEIYYTWAP